MIAKFNLISMQVACLMFVAAAANADAPATTTTTTVMPSSSGSSSSSPFVPSVELSVGTLGIGAHIGGMVANNISARVGGNLLSVSRSVSQSGIDYDASLKLQSVDGLVDLYPGRSTSFHLTLGIIGNTSNVHGAAKPSSNSTVTINGTDYQVPNGASLTGKVSWTGAKPYVGIGFGRPSTKSGRLSFFSDFGAILSDTAKVTIEQHNIPDPNGTLATDIQAQVTKTQSDLNKIKVYPVIMTGFAISF